MAKIPRKEKVSSVCSVNRKAQKYYLAHRQHRSSSQLNLLTLGYPSSVSVISQKQPRGKSIRQFHTQKFSAVKPERPTTTDCTTAFTALESNSKQILQVHQVMLFNLPHVEHEALYALNLYV
ncbi:unnamed protein product [Allacma fusca]|uniref:Uncharacterized protein n=1 Tax=Allacma fusca TaxID=39272 RepID=A0A8J2P9Q5_9HEXA|nr:unnamed protein product [Allacma fusca]